MYRNFALILFASLSFSCKTDKERINTNALPAAAEEIPIEWGAVQSYYQKHIDESISFLDSLKALPMTGKKTQQVFLKMRTAYKKAETYAAYLNPEIGHRTNGPALPIVTDDSQRVLLPIGLQKLEESIFEGEENISRYKEELTILKGLFNNLSNNIKDKEINAQRFFIAVHQQLMRIISFSLSGFDTPVSLVGLQEANTSLQSLIDVYQLSLRPLILKKNGSLDQRFTAAIESAQQFIAQNNEFEHFDRFTFIREYFNPVMRNWIEIRKTANIWKPVDNKPFNFDAPTFFETNSFNTTFFTPPIIRNPTEKQIALGKKLFFDKKLSQSGTMSCATCHNPKKAWADGMIVNYDKEGKPLERNTPTLINAAFQQGYFWDGRSSNIMDQITSVFTNDREFDSSVHRFSNAILSDTTYIDLFKQAYGGISARNMEIIKAISSYITTIKGFNSKFDKNIRGDENSFTEEEKLGFNLYMGKALCATCHFIPLTNGTVPPFFTEHEKEVIGVPKTAANKKLDDDLGFFWRHHEELEVHRGMFKTPTIRNAALTAPYMHNGVYQTLEEVMDFYNKGGGAGLGFDLPHQTLPFDNLNLDDNEIRALVAFTKTLTDDELQNGQDY